MDELDEHLESLDRDGDEDLEALAEILDQLQEDGSMDLEELDGFFAALHCCPEQVPPREFLLEILGSGDSLENEEIFPGPEAAKLVWTLILKHWNAVGDAFRTGDLFDPLLLEDEEGRASGNNWAVGFLRGVDMREELWKELLDDEVKYDWFSPILALAHEGDPDPKLQPYNEPIPEEQRENVLAELSEAVTEIYRHFTPRRELNAASLRQQPFSQQSAKKIGRNDPCYCGSGLKYKKCCGALKVN
jgi:uncharacterized protein